MQKLVPSTIGDIHVLSWKRIAKCTSNTELSPINGHSEPSQSYILSTLIPTLDIKKLVLSTFRDINVLSWKYIAKCTSDMDFCHMKFSISATVIRHTFQLEILKCRDVKNRDKSSFTVHVYRIKFIYRTLCKIYVCSNIFIAYHHIISSMDHLI